MKQSVADGLKADLVSAGLLILGVWACFWFYAVSARETDIPLPPVPAAVSAPVVSSVPKTVTVRTNADGSALIYVPAGAPRLSWLLSNILFEVQTSTNLADPLGWSTWTNAPCWVTCPIDATQPAMYFRVRTTNTLTGEVSDWGRTGP